LDIFLNNSGTAHADGTPLQPCLGTWFWGLGFNPGRWIPKATGVGYEMMPEHEYLKQFKDRVNIYSGMNAYLDGKSPQPHMCGHACALTGSVTALGVYPTAPSLDQIVADSIGTRTRFRSLEIAWDGGAGHSYSRRAGGSINPAEISPLDLYKRV